jgi:chaperonin GroEL
MLDDSKSDKSTHVLFGDDAKKALLAGAEIVAEAVGCTMGPRGKTVLIQQQGKAPVLTKDGVTVARSLRLKDPVKRMGGDLLRDAATRTNEVAGDGTTTATVISYALMRESYKLIAAGVDPIVLADDIKNASEVALRTLKDVSRKVETREDIEHVATISANGDSEIGAIIVDALTKVGRDGIVTVEDAKGTRTSMELVEGLQFDRGYLSPYFVTNNDRMVAQYSDCQVLVTDKKLSTLNDLVPVLEYVHRQGQSLLIIADDIDGDALHGLVLNRVKSNLRVVAVKAPGIGPVKAHILEDIATLVGAQLISAKKGTEMKDAPTLLGTVKRLTVSAKATTLVGTGKTREAVDARIVDLRAQLADPTLDPDERNLLGTRLARLAGGVAVIKVGGATELEMVERRYRIEDALNATRAAIEEGYVAGGGITLMRIAETLAVDVPSLSAACMEPLRRICNNGGVNFDVVRHRWNALKDASLGMGYNAATDEVVDMYMAGIIDPVKVSRTALENAVSVAIAFLTLDAAIYEDEE